jgi:uncharacterized protein YjbJ (UPF0337 family)
MSSNRINGAGKQAVGKTKETLGKAVGNKSLQAKGAAEKTVGSMQNAVGKAQDKLGNTIKK